MAMSDIGSLWEIPSGAEFEDSTAHVKDLMRDQCKYLEKQTSGAIKAQFERVRSFETLTIAARAAMHAGSAIRVQDDVRRADANELYRKETYGFDIYNDQYKFRILEVTMAPVYPIAVWFDEGVLEDTLNDFPLTVERLGDGSKFSVASDDELMGCFSAAVKGKKVRYIISRMLK